MGYTYLDHRNALPAQQNARLLAIRAHKPRVAQIFGPARIQIGRIPNLQKPDTTIILFDIDQLKSVGLEAKCPLGWIEPREAFGVENFAQGFAHSEADGYFNAIKFRPVFFKPDLRIAC